MYVASAGRQLRAVAIAVSKVRPVFDPVAGDVRVSGQCRVDLFEGGLTFGKLDLSVLLAIQLYAQVGMLSDALRGAARLLEDEQVRLAWLGPAEDRRGGDGRGGYGRRVVRLVRRFGCRTGPRCGRCAGAAAGDLRRIGKLSHLPSPASVTTVGCQILAFAWTSDQVGKAPPDVVAQMGTWGRG
ncbi:hypothetical protein GCM10027067_38910 [Pseudactinotalea suaedae]